MKRKLCWILCLVLFCGLIPLERFSGFAASFDYDMSYFVFSDAGVTGDRHPEYGGDKNSETAWSTVDAQKPGMKFIIDMMKIQPVGKIILYHPAQNYPAKFNVYAAKYKEDWGMPVLANVSGSQTDRTSIKFETEINARFLMVELVEGTELNENPWQISELEVLSIADSSKEVKETIVTTNKEQKEDSDALAGKIRLLNSFDIGITGGEEPLTKAAFLEGLLKFSNQYQNIAGGEYVGQSFPDVSASSPYYNLVEYARRSGIIKAGGQFRPGEEIEIKDALEMAVNILGYGTYIQDVSGYIRQASWLGVSAGIQVSSDTLKEKDAVTLFFNLIDIPLLQPSVNANSILSNENAKNAGYVWRRIYRVRGIVNANSSTNISGGAALLEGQVRVEDIIYSAGETDAERFLGYRTELYARDMQGSDDDEILVIYGYQNTVMEIPAANLSRTENNTVYYWDTTSKDGREKRAVLYDNFTMVYNGTVMIPTELSKLQANSGTITLLDNNGDGKYDFVTVNEYVNYYISYLNQSENIIYDKYANPALSLGYKNTTAESVTFYKDGEAISFSSIKPGNIASVVADRTVVDANGLVTVDMEKAKVYNVYISDKTVSGAVTLLDNTGETIEISGRRYKISSTLRNQSQLGLVSMPALGASVTAYLDFCGEVAAVETLAAEGYAYGYVTKVLYDAEQETVGVRLFLQTGKMEVIYFAEKVKIDGTVYKADEEFLKLRFFYKPDESSDTGDKFDPQLIQYKCNGEGRITNIDTKVYDPQKEEKDDTINFYKKSNYAFNTYRNMLFPNEDDGTPNFVTNSMLIFVAPNTESYQNNEDYYRVYDKSFLQHDQYYNMEVYKKSDFNEATVVVIYRDVMGGGSSVSGDSNMVMVDTVDYALDPNDEPKHRLLGTNGRSDLVMYFKDENVLVNAGLMSNGKINLRRGDVVQLTETSGSEILGIVRVYDVTNLDIVLSRGGKYYQASRTTVGQIYDASGNYMLVSSMYRVDDSRAADYAEVYPIPSGVVFDQEEDRVRKVTADDIKAYKKSKDAANTSIVIINTEWGEVKWCIIYNLQNYTPEAPPGS